MATVKLPSGVTVHHTGGAATATSYLVNPVDRPQLKVLANIHIDALERRIRFICAGGASHGGYTHKPCYDRVIAGTAPLDRDLIPGEDQRPFSINKRTVGIEVDGAGGADEWDEWTYRASVAISAACHVAGRVAARGRATGRCPQGTHEAEADRSAKPTWGSSGPTSWTAWRTRGLRWSAGRSSSWVTGCCPAMATTRALTSADLVNLLIALGYDIQPDDEFGPEVEAAVIDFQGKHALTADGIVRLDTVEAIKRALTRPGSTHTETPAVEPGAEPEGVPPAEPIERSRRFRFGQANLQAERFGGVDDSSPRRGEFLRDEMNCSIYALCEVSEEARNAIREGAGRIPLQGVPDRIRCA